MAPQSAWNRLSPLCSFRGLPPPSYQLNDAGLRASVEENSSKNTSTRVINLPDFSWWHQPPIFLRVCVFLKLSSEIHLCSVLISSKKSRNFYDRCTFRPSVCVSELRSMQANPFKAYLVPSIRTCLNSACAAFAGRTCKILKWVLRSMRSFDDSQTGPGLRHECLSATASIIARTQFGATR